MMVIKPSTTNKSLLYDNLVAIFLGNKFLKFEQFAETKEYFLSDHFDFYFDDVHSVFQHLVCPFCCTKNCNLRHQI